MHKRYGDCCIARDDFRGELTQGGLLICVMPSGALIAGSSRQEPANSRAIGIEKGHVARAGAQGSQPTVTGCA